MLFIFIDSHRESIFDKFFRETLEAEEVNEEVACKEQECKESSYTSNRFKVGRKCSFEDVYFISQSELSLEVSWTCLGVSSNDRVY